VLLDGSTKEVKVITTGVHLSFAASTPDGTKIMGQFYLTDPDGSNPSGFQDIGPVPIYGAQFENKNNVPQGKHLRFKVKATAPSPAPGEDPPPVVLLHRTHNTRYWED
jgi:hypothetical protein